MRVYRWLLRQCPAALRRDFGAAMEDMCAERLADAARAGRWTLARVWLREIAGLIAMAVRQRWRAARARRHRQRHAAHEKAGFMDVMTLEVRQAIRRLRKSPAFSLASILTLGLAIGANAAIFAVVQRVVLNPLPYPDSDQLIAMEHGARALNATGLEMTSGLYFQYSERAQTLAGVALYTRDHLTLTGEGDPERIRTTRATPSLLAVLQSRPVLGRWFSDADATPGATPVAVLSDALWARRYGRDRNVIGRSIMLGGMATEIVGVMPASFAFPERQVEIWTPTAVARAQGLGLWSYSGVARLRDGVALADARLELDSLIEDIPQAFPEDARAVNLGTSQLYFDGRPLKEMMVGSVERALWMLLASVGLVLLIACANVANLFLVRSEARQREVMVRRALGASRGRIARYFMTESVLLSLAGGVIGLTLAWWAVRLVVGFGPPNLPRLDEIRLDGVALAFTLAVSLVAAVALAVIPLWRGRSTSAALHDGGRANTVSRSRHRARQVLMGAQVALALVLLVASGLMARSFQTLRTTDPGFDASSALTFSLGLPARAYPTQVSAINVHRAILDKLSAMPGVVAASASTCLPLHGGCFGNTLRVQGRVYPPGTLPQIAVMRAVASHYFSAVGTRLIRGRTITQSDIDHREPVVVVSDALARKFFPNQDPIGQRIASNRAPAKVGERPELTWLTIVGVVVDTPTGVVLPGGNPLPQVFMPMSIAGGPGIPISTLVGPDISLMSYVVRTSTPPLAMQAAVRDAVRSVDGDLALAQVRTLEDILTRASARMAFSMVLLAIAAAVALVLGAIGIYGVMSYIVSQRTSEIGVRLALGADPRHVANAIVRQGAMVTLAGVAIGLAVALAGSRLIESLLFGISARDPGVFGVTTLMLLAVALLACWLPARRASRLSPVDALRVD